LHISPRYIVDADLYAYEIATSTLVRVLQLSIPDENTAQTIGLLFAVVEVMVRIFFYTMFLKAGLRKPLMTAAEKVAHAMRGKLRVQDASNDMLVEVRKCASEARQQSECSRFWSMFAVPKLNLRVSTFPVSRPASS
jgi:hypothetical protein